jgi:hypothetical protein
MNPISTMGVDADEHPTVSDTSISCNPKATDEAAQTATAIPPFFRLPRELRDEICELAALSEQTLYHDIELRAEGPAQKAVYVDRGAPCTFPNSQFEVEYSAAVEKRVKSLMNGRDRNRLKLWGPGPLEYVRRADPIMVRAKDVWLETSKGPRPDGQVSYNIHTLVLVIPLRSIIHEEVPYEIELEARVIFEFRFPDKAELGPRLRLDCCWDGDGPDQGDNLHMPSYNESVVQRVLSIAKETNWKGSVREYMLWQCFIVKYVHRGLSRASY